MDRAGRVLFWAVVTVLVVGFIGSFRAKAEQGLVQALVCETVSQMEEVTHAFIDGKDMEAAIAAINARDGPEACGVARMVISAAESVKEDVYNKRAFTILRLKIVAVVTPMGMIPLEASWYATQIPTQKAGFNI